MRKWQYVAWGHDNILHGGEGGSNILHAVWVGGNLLHEVWKRRQYLTLGMREKAISYIGHVGESNILHGEWG